jgi:hypothetical protein
MTLLIHCGSVAYMASLLLCIHTLLHCTAITAKQTAADPTKLTALALQRAAAAASEGTYLLPKDMHFRAKDLARLFMRKTAVARRADDSATDATSGTVSGGSGNANALLFAGGDGDAGDQFDGEIRLN